MRAYESQKTTTDANDDDDADNSGGSGSDSEGNLIIPLFLCCTKCP